jgi:hypothetical protein
VAYWAIRGLGAPFRMMVLFAAADNNNNVVLKANNYNLQDKEGGGFDASHWFSAKAALKERNPLMNLPHVIIGDHVVSQSNACFLALGRRFNMLGDTPQDLSSCEQLLCEIMDLRDKMIEKCYIYSPQISPESAKGLIDEAAGKNSSLAKLELWLEREVAAGRQGTHLVADKATAPDFHLFEMLDQYTAFARYYGVSEQLLVDRNLPRLQHFHTTFRAHPRNAAYFNSVLYRLPFNNKSAAYGSTPSGDKWVPGTVDEFANSSGVFTN